MSRAEMTNSVEAKMPNFQKDVIIPQIYDLKNIKLIQNFGYKSSPVNKVAELKKKKIQNVIRGIVDKQKVEPAQTDPLWTPLSARKQPKKIKRSQSHCKELENIKHETLFMDIDEQIGEMIALADENFAPFAERVKGVLKKVSFHAKDQEMVKKAKDAEFYMNALCRNGGRKMNPEKVRPVKGLIDEINQRQNRSQDKPVKPRAQSASISRSQSDFQHSPSLYKTKDFTRSSSNLKQNTRGASHKSRSKLIIQSINDCLQEEGKINLGTRQKIDYMKGEWARDGNIQKTFARSSETILNPSVLTILKDKRLKLQALARIDNEYFK